MDTKKLTEETVAIEVPEAVQKEARSIVSGAFQLFTDHTRRMTDDLAEFNEERRKVSENIDRGIKRTSGRIV